MRKIFVFVVLLSTLAISLALADHHKDDEYTKSAKMHHKMAVQKKKEAKKSDHDTKAHHQLKAQEHREKAKESEYMAKYHDVEAAKMTK